MLTNVNAPAVGINLSDQIKDLMLLLSSQQEADESFFLSIPTLITVQCFKCFLLSAITKLFFWSEKNPSHVTSHNNLNHCTCLHSQTSLRIQFIIIVRFWSKEWLEKLHHLWGSNPWRWASQWYLTALAVLQACILYGMICAMVNWLHSRIALVRLPFFVARSQTWPYKACFHPYNSIPQLGLPHCITTSACLLFKQVCCSLARWSLYPHSYYNRKGLPLTSTYRFSSLKILGLEPGACIRWNFISS